MKAPLKTVLVLSLTIVLTIALSVPSAQTPAGEPFRIERLSPALDDIVSPDTKLETLGDRFALTEGPLWIPPGAAGNDGADGYLLFSDNAANVIYKWAPNRPLAVFLEKSGFTGPTTRRSGRRRFPAASASCSSDPTGSPSIRRVGWSSPP